MSNESTNKSWSKQCCQCPYFMSLDPDVMQYYFDEYGVKHCKVKFICLYDMHVVCNGHKCIRGNKDNDQ